MAKILIVDDDPSLGRILSHYCKKSGYAVRWVETASRGDELLRSESFDAVLLDIRLGDASGLELIASWTSEIKDLPPIIMMTGENTPSNAMDSMVSGAYDYLVKPFDLEELGALLTKATGDSHAEVQADQETETLGVMVGRSPVMQEVYKKIGLYCRHDGTVLIQGESGAGKELVAAAIHEKSDRSSGPFVAINMSAIPDALLESELFGYEKGAFTGADKAQPGKFRTANGGTLFLDEIGDMPMSVQAKLLRVLQQKEVTPVGSVQTHPIDVRIVAATQVDLAKAVEEDRFRQDLYFRLNVLPLWVPPLRERLDDLPELVKVFVSKNDETKHKVWDEEALKMLRKHAWPGNVRELQNVVERVSLLAAGSVIEPTDVRQYAGIEMRGFQEPMRAGQSIEDFIFPVLEDLLEASSNEALRVLLDPIEEKIITKALRHFVGNQIKVAEFLGVNRNTLRKRIQEFDIDVASLKEEAKKIRKNTVG